MGLQQVAMASSGCIDAGPPRMHDPSMRSTAAGSFLAWAALGWLGVVPAGARTVGLTVHDPAEALDGYTLWTPLYDNRTYLIDKRGRVVNAWPPTSRGHAIVYLLPNGNLLRTGQADFNPTFGSGRGSAGIVEEVDWDGTVVWQFTYSTPLEMHHHDVERLPNGNVLMIAWEFKTRNEAIDAGRDPAQTLAVWPDHVIEVEPTPPTGGNIVWEWHLWDHLVQDFDPAQANYGVVADHPELVDVNYMLGPGADWNHLNAVAYHPALDQVVLSSRPFSEVWVIDHSTTSAEAAGHTGGRSGKGGDLLYRWGNPAAYDHGTAADRQLYFQHDVQWVPAGRPGAGNLLVFNNGPRPGADFSSVTEWTTPVDGMGAYAYTPRVPFAPTAPTWEYTASPATDFYSAFISGAERMANGKIGRASCRERV